jgi:myo-inositol-1(or 4)-monophosphatase
VGRSSPGVGRRVTSAEPAELLELACEAAETAAGLLLERYDTGSEAALATKTTPTDLVSEADLASERTIRTMLAARRPDDGFLGEEGTEVTGSTGLRWIVDPLDGTVNFLFGIPQWCVSVAVADEDGALAGAICDPIRRELFAAVRGQAPTLNGEATHASRCEDLATAMVATGFAYDAAVRTEQGQVFAGLIDRVRDIRRFGSAALDLAWTAVGRFDAYFERAVNPWDVAAGELACRCAGLKVLDMPATATLPYGVLAGAPAIAGRLHALVT